MVVGNRVLRPAGNAPPGGGFALCSVMTAGCPAEEDPTLGRCFACGYLWCLECGRALDPKEPRCSCYEENLEARSEKVDGRRFHAIRPADSPGDLVC
jgi:hypothetical protein